MTSSEFITPDPSGPKGHGLSASSPRASDQPSGKPEAPVRPQTAGGRLRLAGARSRRHRQRPGPHRPDDARTRRLRRLVSRVTLGDVGIIFSYDVTRLSRNCSDWYQLLDLCGFRHCLIGDHDSIYDPSSINGRMLLGLKGQISELELHTIKARLHAGLINKARRGDLRRACPSDWCVT